MARISEMSSIIKSTDENSQIREAQAAEEVEDEIKRYGYKEYIYRLQKGQDIRING